MMKFLPGEETILNLAPVKMLMYKWTIGHFYWTKKVIVTNKRILISFQWFGIESFSPALSCYYNEHDYKNYKKFGDSLLVRYELGKGKILGEFIKLVVKQRFMNSNVKIYTKENYEIEKIIKRNS